MKLLSALAAVVILTAIGLAGGSSGGLQSLFGILIPYLAVATFIVGIVLQVIKWGRSAVPFCIPTTCGQQRALPWIPNDSLEAPHTTTAVLKRMFLEVFLFRSLFRNTRMKLQDGNLVYGSTKWLWLGGLAFHYAFFTILIRHLRFFLEPIPAVIVFLDRADSFLQIGLPALYLTDGVLLAALAFLLARRLFEPQVRYISFASDFFPLLLIGAIGTTGVLMRYFVRVDVTAIKQLAMSLATFSPAVPAGVGSLFFAHLFLICVLLAYFPFSKLLHAPGVFMSPTRNLANNSREVRHINPWNPQVKVHTYEEWEEEFHVAMKKAGFPLDKEYKE
ncbi:MAG: sulfate reduction electron transfer complex DsrMKJOP subunit DsrM [Candidatus Methylomirabilia bacterium]